MEKSIFVGANHRLLQFSGRIDWNNPEEPIFVFPCSFVKIRFYGSGLQIVVTNRKSYWDSYLGVLIDGVQLKAAIPDGDQVLLDIGNDLVEGEHEVMVFKRMDGCHEITLHGFYLREGGYLLPIEPLPSKKIEVYGDSISAGEIAEAVNYAGKADPEHNGEYSNGWYSYAWLTARKLQAQIHNIAQGGVALLDHTGWFSPPDYIGMESIWDKIRYNPDFTESTKWEFEKYTPQVVIVAIGQNDSHPVNYMKENYYCDRSNEWRNAYKEFLFKIRGKYPNALVVLTTTILEHDKSWDDSIEQVCNEINDKKIVHFLYSKNGCGTPGHVRIPEAEIMAEELTAYIESFGMEIWEEA